jgi:hypothetical protein
LENKRETEKLASSIRALESSAKIKEDNLTSQLNESNENLNRNSQELKEALRNVAQLENWKISASESIENLKKEVQSLKDENNSKDEKLSKKDHEIQQLNERCQALQKKEEEMLSTKEAELQKRKDSLIAGSKENQEFEVMKKK